MAADFSNYEIRGHNYTIAFGGQTITGAKINGATVSGTFVGTTAVLEDCIINAITGPGMTMRRCFLNEVTVTANGVGDWFLNDCKSRVAGTGSPNFDFGAAVGNTNLNMRAYSGGIELENMGQTGTDVASIEGDGNVIVNVNSTGGTIVIRGDFDLTDNGSATITQTARPAYRFGQIEGSTFSTSTDSLEAIRDSQALASVQGTLADAAADGDPTSADTVMQYLKQLVNVLVGSDGVTTYPAAAAPGNAVSLAEILRSIYDDTAVDGVKLNATQPAGWAANLVASAGQIIKATVDTVTNTHTPTTTEFQADDITEATADHYNGRIVIFTTGNLAGQATDITDYEAVGGIGQFTVTALTEAPANDDEFVIV